jgi:O-antigen/teichoic acid export membrane protein
MSSRGSYSAALALNILNFSLVAVLGLVGGVITARLYGARVLGEFALVTATANAVMMLSTARERPAFVREVAMLQPRDLRLSALFVAMLTFSFTLTVCVGMVLLVGAYFLFNGPIGHPELFVPAIATVAYVALFDNTISQVDTVFTVFRQGGLLFRTRTLQAVAFFVLTIALGILHPTVWALIASSAAASFLGLAARLTALRQYVTVRIPRPELREGFRSLPDLLRFGIKIAPGAIADGLSTQLGTWVLGAVGSLREVGAYNRALQLARSMLLFNVRITEMLFPTLIERHKSGDHAGFDRALLDTMRYCAAGLLLLAAVGGGAAHGIMAIYGAGFAAGAEALPWLMAIPALLTLSMIQRHALYIFDKPIQATVSALLRLAVTLAATIPLSLAWSVRGPAVAIFLGLVADLANTTRQVAPRLSTPVRSLWPARQAVGLVVAFAGGFAAARSVDLALSGALGTVAALAAGTAIYAGVLLVVGGIGPRDAERLRALLRFTRRGRATAGASAQRAAMEHQSG